MFDGRKKRSRLSRYGSSSHRRLQINHALVAAVLGKIDGGGGGEDADLCVGSIVMFWVEEQGGEVGYGMVVSLPRSALVLDAKTLRSTKKKDAVTVRPLVKCLETAGGDYYSIELELTCVLPRSIVLYFPPSCRLPPADDDDDDELREPDDGLFMQIFISAESKYEHHTRRGQAAEAELARAAAATSTCLTKPGSSSWVFLREKRMESSSQSSARAPYGPAPHNSRLRWGGGRVVLGLGRVEFN